MTNDEFCRGVRHGERRYNAAFTLIELIVVTTVIIILTGLVLSTVGYIQKKGARARAETEIAAMSAACESYKADNGVYPTDASTTEQLDSTASFNPVNYQSASLYLYKRLSGDTSANRQPSGKSYMTFKPNMLLPRAAINCHCDRDCRPVWKLVWLLYANGRDGKWWVQPDVRPVEHGWWHNLERCPAMDQKLVGRDRQASRSPFARVHNDFHAAVGTLFFN
jgi:type II secretory pathway pseudopilin PulG